jgi:hypothetical protein
MVKILKADGAAEHCSKMKREFALRQSVRADGVFDALVEVLEATPEVLSSEYSDDLLCDLVRSYVPDVTSEEIVTALNMLSVRATSLREFMQNKRRPGA